MCDYNNQSPQLINKITSTLLRYPQLTPYVFVPVEVTDHHFKICAFSEAAAGQARKHKEEDLASGTEAKGTRNRYGHYLNLFICHIYLNQP